MIKFIVLASILLSAVFGQQCTGTCANDGDCAIFTDGRFCSGTTCTARLADGATCSRNAQCFSGFCDGTTCAPLRYPGCQCSNNNQCITGACVNNACVSGSTRSGSACTVDDQCFSGSCVNGTCAASTILGTCLVTACPTGQVCALGACLALKNVGESCGVTAPCNQGLICDGIASGTCRTPLASGATCTATAGGVNLCGTGLVCDGTFTNSTGTCVAVIATGGNCSNGLRVFDSCDATSSCNATSGRCDPTTCSFFKTGTNCADGRVCALGQCRFVPQTRNAGQVCDNNADCSGNNVCVGTTTKTCTAPVAAGTACNVSNVACASKDGSGCGCAAAGANTQTTCTAGPCGGALTDAYTRCLASNQCGGSDYQCILNNCNAQYNAVSCCQCSNIAGLIGSQQLPITGTCAGGLSFTPCCPGTGNVGTCGTPTALCTAPAPPSAASSTIVSFVVLAIAFVLALAF